MEQNILYKMKDWKFSKHRFSPDIHEILKRTSGLKSLEPDTSLPKSTVDDDDDELEALRTAALLSMKVREKRNLSAVNSEAHERSGSYSGYSCLPKHSNERATAPGKPLFSWKQHTRPNLIVIQPVSLEGKEAASPCSASNLVLPQDRWCPKQGQESPASSGTGQSKRRASGKFSHFESSSESEESDDDLLRSGSALSHSDGSIDGHSSDDEQNSTQASSSFRFTQDCLDSCLSLRHQNSGNISPGRHITRKSRALEELQQKRDEERLINGLSSDGQRPLHLSPENTREDRLVPPPRERHSSREGTPGSTRSVDSQDRSASSVFEARRRKFECTVPVNPVGGKILLLRQGRTEDQSPHREGSSPISSPCAQTRSRSRSASPPLLRSVLSVVKRGPCEVSPACTESKKHRSGRTVEVIVRSVGEEPTDTSERVGKSSSKKLPVHLRLGDASTVSSTRKKKSKRKRSPHDSRAYSVKRKHTSARGLDSNVRRAWLGRDQHCNRRKRMPSGLSDGTP
ncbi:hypothetical protein HPB51_021100 [Rhipicephalus microplus]|uniref:Uncharacterized protein n=1 Tax=Rhipicephalus microplus TaxID=6941 RepID=A0A9J6EJD5_RHIMP|nr:hypothetical protein HPB51_021100 [Rhipicephalus microplus]